jgi:hypothetical protein
MGYSKPEQELLCIESSIQESMNNTVCGLEPLQLDVVLRLMLCSSISSIKTGYVSEYPGHVGNKSLPRLLCRHGISDWRSFMRDVDDSPTDPGRVTTKLCKNTFD